MNYYVRGTNRLVNPEPNRLTLDCCGRSLPLQQQTLIMGILNMTPDSFSDGGQYADVRRAVERAKQMVAEGADLIDVGGESTRPGAERVSLELELQRVLPVVQALVNEIQVPISVDTYKPEVAEQALAAGAHLINDVWGLRLDERMAQVVARFRCPIVIMHNRKQEMTGDVVQEVIDDLKASIAIAHQAGIADSQIVLDPGIGFAKTHQQNLQLLAELHQLVRLGYPVVLGTSRKRVVRNTIEATVDDCVEGTAATVAFGIAQGCNIMRVHDVREMKRVALMCDAMMKVEV